MAESHHCGETADLPYKCQYCGGVYCGDDRLPESHECDGVRFLSDAGKRFESTFSDDVVESGGEDFEPPESIDPEYTVGSRPDPAYESGPDVRLKGSSDQDGDAGTGILARLRRILGL